MNGIEFLKYFLDTHPWMFGFGFLILCGGIATFLGNIGSTKHK